MRRAFFCCCLVETKAGINEVAKLLKLKWQWSSIPDGLGRQLASAWCVNFGKLGTNHEPKSFGTRVSTKAFPNASRRLLDHKVTHDSCRRSLIFVLDINEATMELLGPSNRHFVLWHLGIKNVHEQNDLSLPNFLTFLCSAACQERKTYRVPLEAVNRGRP